ncbi:similarity with Nitrogen-fixing NifU-like proteins [Bryobacterales bacterium F-183]|nr:similarity with Nitrogen-fixing NifU-like proteins [Bryobacterales bacterium F-183]
MTPHPKLLDHFTNPRNAGTLPCPPAIRVQTDNPACGDTLILYVETDGQQITNVRYQVRGCTASIAAGSALTTLLEGRSISTLNNLQASDIEAEIGELQPASKHAAVLCRDTVTRLLQALR